MQKLINAVQNYAWGSHTALTELYGIANSDNLPMAELWMGRIRRAVRRSWRPTASRVRCAR